MDNIYVDTLKDWSPIAIDILASLNQRTTICMTGPLGAGKTSLTRAIVAALGGAEQEVQSPTFSLVHEYHLSTDAMYKKVYHLDLYRIEDAKELLAIGLYDLLDSKDLVIIEWPEIAYPLMDKNEYISLVLEHHKSGRRLTLEK